MHIFHNRPLMLACCIAAACAFGVSQASCHLSLILLTLFALGLAVSSLLFLWRHHKCFFLAALSCCLATISCVSSFLFFHVRTSHFEALVDLEFVIEGTVLKRMSNTTYASKLYIELESLGGNSCVGDLYVNCNYGSALQPGDRFRMRVTGIAEREKETDEIVHCSGLSDGVMLTVSCDKSEDCTFLGENNSSWRLWLYERNEALSFRLRECLGQESGTLASALLLGNREALEEQTSLNFKRAGISHLLALSGLHVSILIGFAEWFLLRLRISKGIRLAVTATLAIFYLFLTGASPSTARAVLMFFGLALGYYLRAEYDSLTSLSVALILLIVLTPYSVLDLGMWMSFLAASSIIIFLPILQNGFERFYQRFEPPIWLYKLITGTISALYIGIVANLAMLVVLVYAYGEIAWMSVPATLILSIPMSAGLLSALVTLFLPLASPLCGLCMKGMLHIADRISDMQDILLPANDILTQLCAVLLFTSIVFLAVAKLKRLMWGLLPIGLASLCILSSIGGSYFPNHGVRMDYVSSSGGDLLLFTEQSRSVAVDFSDGTAGGAYALANTAATARCTELDDLILTHYHNKDTYFLNALAATVLVRNLRLPMPCNDWEAGVAMRLHEEAERLGIAVHFDTQDLAIPQMQILANEREIFSSGRHTALLFSVRIGNNDVTYVNASVPSSDLFSLASERIGESEILMLGSTGFSTSANDLFPYLLHTPDEILILDKRLIKLLPNIPDESRCKIAPIEEYYCYFP